MKQIEFRHLGISFNVQYFDDNELHAVYTAHDLSQLDNLIDFLKPEIVDLIEKTIIEHERPTETEPDPALHKDW